MLGDASITAHYTHRPHLPGDFGQFAPAAPVCPPGAASIGASPRNRKGRYPTALRLLARNVITRRRNRHLRCGPRGVAGQYRPDGEREKARDRERSAQSACDAVQSDSRGRSGGANSAIREPAGEIPPRSSGGLRVLSRWIVRAIRGADQLGFPPLQLGQHLRESLAEKPHEARDHSRPDHRIDSAPAILRGETEIPCFGRFWNLHNDPIQARVPSHQHTRMPRKPTATPSHSPRAPARISWANCR
jgi:hypothetical protein